MLEIGRESVYGEASDELLAEAADELVKEAMLDNGKARDGRGAIFGRRSSRCAPRRSWLRT